MSEKPIFEVARWPQPADAYLLKNSGELVPLASIPPASEMPQLDVELHERIGAVSARIAAVAPLMEALGRIAPAMALVEAIAPQIEGCAGLRGRGSHADEPGRGGALRARVRPRQGRCGMFAASGREVGPADELRELGLSPSER